MLFNLAFSGSLISLLLASQLLWAQEVHMQDEAELNLAAQGHTLSIEFVSPAANLLGFERMPESSNEWSLLASVIEQLESIQWLMSSQLTECSMEIESLEIPSFSASSHVHAGHGAEAHDHDSHSEESDSDAHGVFRVQYLFNCSGEVPAEYEIAAFSYFPNLQQLVTHWSRDDAAGITKLTTASTVLLLK
ncbi:MAG: DUF2796 domain-containing protein [Pseudohongiellaceae bacterium]